MEPPPETSSSSSSSRRRVSLPASASSQPLFFKPSPPPPSSSSSSSTATSLSNPTNHPAPSTFHLLPSTSASTSSALPPSTRMFAAPPSSSTSRLHQRAKSSGYGGIQGGQGANTLSRSISSSGAPGPSTSTLLPPLAPQLPASATPLQPDQKRTRKKWSEEETKQLVEGCNKWGVGSWRAILDDPTLTFEDRTAVDLKDRFRTYFPIAYHQLYPGAKTHIPATTATDPKRDELGLKLEKKEVKKKRPFTASEDLALKAGFDQHGAAWAKICKDSIFQGRKSIDLRDRFRNVFPELYSKAGFKPRLTRAKTTPVPNTVDGSGSLSDFGPAPTPSSASSSSGRRASSAYGFTSGPPSRSSTTATSPLPLLGPPPSRSIKGSSSSVDRRRSASVVESSEPSSSNRPRRPITARRASFSNTSTAAHPYLPAPTSASTPSGTSSSYLYHPPSTPSSSSFSFSYPNPTRLAGPSTSSPRPHYHPQPDLFPSPPSSLPPHPQPSDLIPHRSWSSPNTSNASTQERQPNVFTSPPTTKHSDDHLWLAGGGAGSNFISDEQHTLGGSSSTSSWLPSHYGLPEDFGSDLGGGPGLPWPSASDSGAQDGDYCISETGSSATTPAPNTSVFKFTHHPTAGDLIYSSNARGPTLFNLDHLTLPAMGMDLASMMFPPNYADTSGSSFDVDLDLDLDLMSDGGESAASMRLAASKMQIGQQHQHHQHHHHSYSDSQSLSSFHHHPNPPAPSSHQSEPNLAFYNGPSTSSPAPFSITQSHPFEPPPAALLSSSSSSRHPQPLQPPPPLTHSSSTASETYHPLDWPSSSSSFDYNLAPPSSNSSRVPPAWSTPAAFGTTQDDINLDSSGGEGMDRKRKRVASRVGGAEESGLHWLDLSMFGGEGGGGSVGGTN
ncbi:hypothetical protein BDY24DRAFT_114575 [Mrakia frigida]|uniref:telomere repeat binding factor family protein n=1 Tax=Mrakia frigida TaxID=29902 RepID=UPI003FCC1208